jgi:hypothetical protein
MPQHDYDIANQTGAAFRADLNTCLSAVVTLNSGSAEPATTYAHMLWADITAGQLKQRNAANSAWVVIGTLGTTGWGLAPTASPTFTGTATLANLTASGTATLASLTVSGAATLTGTGALKLPAGSTAQRPTAATGQVRFNSTLTQFEGYNGTSWGTIGGGAKGGGADQVFYENGQTVTTDYTIGATTNAMSAGPITINSGVTVTVNSGGNWVLV